MHVQFDPWNSSFEDAQLAHRESDGPTGAIFQWAAAQKIKQMQAKDSRDGFDVLSSVAACAVHGLVIPDWLALEFLRRYRAVQQLRVDSWADPASFGRAYPKGTQVPALRRRRSNRYTVGLAVAEFVRTNPTAPLDGEWERFGALIAKSDKETQKIFAEAVKLGIVSSPTDIRKSLGFPAVPSKFRKLRGRQK